MISCDRRMIKGKNGKGENLYKTERDWMKQFWPIISSHFPLDFLIIFLGTNDMNSRANKTPKEISKDLEEYISLNQKYHDEMNIKNTLRLIFIAPPLVREEYLPWDCMFIWAGEKSQKLGWEIEKMTQKNKALFFDASIFVSASEVDWVHLDEENNMILWRALAQFVKSV